MFLRTIIVFIAVLAALPNPAQAADTLVSTFGPLDSFSTTQRPPISGSATFLGYQARGMRFTIGLDRSLTSVELAMRHTSGSNSYRIELSADLSGQPGVVLESWLSAAPTPSEGIVALASVGSPLLLAGGTYWLTASPETSTTNGGWFSNDQGINSNGIYARNSASAAWSSVASSDLAFRVSGVTAPEPLTGGIFLMGLFCLALKSCQQQGY